MIFLVGIPSEPSLGLVIKEIERLGFPHVVFHQRHFDSVDIDFSMENGHITGQMSIQGKNIPLANFTGVYTRMMDFRLLPEIEKETPGSVRWHHGNALHDTILRWIELTPARVLNRYADIGSNFSKPYQAQLILKYGFRTPETLVTNQPDLVHDFLGKHKRIIYKSVSYVRSIVQEIKESDLKRLNAIRCCPVQFQEYIDGINVRVHTIGDKVFACSIESPTTDYRYAYIEGGQEVLTPIEISDDLAEACIGLSRSLGLEFGGVDLKITPENRVYCLEVNPCPAFSYYEMHTGLPIARAVAHYLTESV